MPRFLLFEDDLKLKCVTKCVIQKKQIPASALLTGIIMERMTGIEPAYSAWEADVLPLNYIRDCKLLYNT